MAAAARCAVFVVDSHVVSGRLRRSSLGGAVGAAAGVLADHAALATGLLALHQASGERRWLAQACQVLDAAVAHFGDESEPGAWFDTADDAEALVRRPRDPFDGATPSGASLLAEALLTASVLVGAGAGRAGTGRWRRRLPWARAGLLLATSTALRRALVERRRGRGRPARCRSRWSAGESWPTWPARTPPAVRWWWQARTGLVRRCSRTGRSSTATPAAYVCRGFVCDRPVTDSRLAARGVAGRERSAGGEQGWHPPRMVSV